LHRTYDIGVAPHCPLGPIAFAAALQIGFSTPNFVICEMSWKVNRSLSPVHLITPFFFRYPRLRILDSTSAVSKYTDITKQMHYNSEEHDLFTYLADATPFAIQDGYIALLLKPGLGIEIDESKVRSTFNTSSIPS
jgi:galactonate dehydratase